MHVYVTILLGGVGRGCEGPWPATAPRASPGASCSHESLSRQRGSKQGPSLKLLVVFLLQAADLVHVDGVEAAFALLLVSRQLLILDRLETNRGVAHL